MPTLRRELDIVHRARPLTTAATRASAVTNVVSAGTFAGSLAGGLAVSLGGAEVSNPASPSSDNRYEDFENGVLFWRRGAPAATQVTPWLQAADGTRMHWTAAEVQAAALPVINQALAGLSGLSVGSVV